MSSSYIGSSGFGSSGGSDYGASGLSSGGHSSSMLTSQILSSVALTGENIALHAAGTGLVVPSTSAPVTTKAALNATAFSNVQSSKLMSWLVIALVALVGLFAYKKL